ncbi:unnamed protein product [Blumeria hordei]|uniref:Stress-associated endoplasmic reticulum protein n=2 Tax=Blumeria hordei TaxID=2867405 RepID=A0A383UW42_BLUHO|nr:hypothetical protein BGHDH14_bgh03232 [Blumeria hordei DH14]SZF04541.1 unnamed protein product [Blumeria hordei]
MAQTPQQRKRNEKFSKLQNAKRGKANIEVKPKQEFKSPLSPLWAGLLSFVVFGGLLFELINRIFIH